MISYRSSTLKDHNNFKDVFNFRTIVNRLAAEHANLCNEIELENKVLEKLTESADQAE